jgi:FkbM family methyltransferase
MAGVNRRARVLLRSGSLSFTRDHVGPARAGARGVYRWKGLPVHYRCGTSDTHLIYSLLLKRGRKHDYALPPESGVAPADVRTVVDIGANAGIAARYFAATFGTAEVHAFEPEPGNCELLRANAAECPRIRVHPFALGERDGELTLYHSDDATNLGGFSSHGLGIDAARSLRVPVRHAGRALAELGIGSIDVLKIDTEGHEFEILTAIDPALLATVRVIIGELHGSRDFQLLDYLQPMFDIGVRKRIRDRLFTFYAVRRAAP